MLTMSDGQGVGLTQRCLPSDRTIRSHHRSAGLAVVVGVAGSALGGRQSSFASVAALA